MSEPKSASRPGWLRRSLAFIGPPVGVAAAFVGVWALVSSTIDDPRNRQNKLPYPTEVFDRVWTNSRTMREIVSAFFHSLGIVLGGLAIAIAIGMIIAIAMSQARWIERMLFPYAVVLQTIPIIAISPLIGVLFGFRLRSQIIVCVLISLFPIITNTLFGLKSADANQHDLFTLHGASRWTRLRKLQLPGALPAIFTGFRISAGLSVIGAIVGEFFFKSPLFVGLGQRIVLYQSRNGEVDRIITAVLFSCLLGVALFGLFGWLNNRITGHWRPEVVKHTRSNRSSGSRASRSAKIPHVASS